MLVGCGGSNASVETENGVSTESSSTTEGESSSSTEGKVVTFIAGMMNLRIVMRLMQKI